MVRLFGIGSEGSFREYVETEFEADHQEAILEAWLEKNPESILEDGKLLIIGRQLRTNLGSVIDLLGIDRHGSVVVIELKRDRTPRDTLAQVLEYASFAESLSSEQLESVLRSYSGDDAVSLALYHREYFELIPDETVVFNEDQRLVIVGQQVTPEIRQTAVFLRRKGIRVTCLEFTFFEADAGLRLLSSDLVVGTEPAQRGPVATGSLPRITPDGFLASLDSFGQAVFPHVLEFARQRSCPIHWGTKGFSLNADVRGTHVVLCYGFPPGCVYGQSIYTALVGQGGLLSKLAAPEAAAQDLAKLAQSTGLFQPAGREHKCPITRQLTAAEIQALLSWLDEVNRSVHKYEFKAVKHPEP